MKKPYLPAKESERVIWLNTFAGKIGTYSAQFGISALELAAIAAMALIYAYIIGLIDMSKNYTKELTKFKNKLSKAPIGSVLGSLPVLTPGVAPTLTQAGIFTFISGIVGRIKSSATYTEAIGEALGIIGEETIFISNDYIANGVAVSRTGYVANEFDKSHLDGMNIYSLPLGSSDVALMEKIGTASFSPFHDTRPLQTPGKPEKRYYQNHGIVHDVEIGHPSEVFSVLYAG